uniref:Uncharacterized protein n=1 Tax=Oryza rufipogon TaxID=4529 RepID=A0A0E0R7W7_ORYRU
MRPCGGGGSVRCGGRDTGAAMRR